MNRQTARPSRRLDGVAQVPGRLPPASSRARRVPGRVARTTEAMGVLALAVAACAVPWGFDVHIASIRWLTVVSGAVGAACVFWLLTPSRWSRPTWADAAVVALAAWAVASLTWSVSTRFTWYGVDAYVLAAAAFVTAHHLPRTSRQRALVAGAFVAGSVVVAAGVVVSWHWNLGPPGRPRAFGINPNQISYTLLAAVTVVLAVLVLTHRAAPGRLRDLLRPVRAPVPSTGDPGRNRFAGLPGTAGAAVVLVVLLAGMAIIGSRGAFVGIPLAAVVAVLPLRLARAQLVLHAVAWIGLTAVSLRAVPTGLLVGIDAASSRATGDLSGRLQLWPVAQDVIAQHPLTGIGAGAFPAVTPLRIGAHNLALGVTSELGLVGLVLYTAWVLFAVSRVLRRGDRVAMIALGCVLAGWFPVAFSGQWDYATVPFLLLGLATGRLRPPRTRAVGPPPAGSRPVVMTAAGTEKAQAMVSMQWPTGSAGPHHEKAAGPSEGGADDGR